MKFFLFLLVSFLMNNWENLAKMVCKHHVPIHNLLPNIFSGYFLSNFQLSSRPFLFVVNT